MKAKRLVCTRRPFWLVPSLLLALYGLPAQASTYVFDQSSDLWVAPTPTDPFGLVGNSGILFYDIAISPSGELYGVTFTSLYRIDTSTAAPTLVGDLGAASNQFASALTFSPSGTLYLATASPERLYTLNTLTGMATLVGSIGFPSSGDLAFRSNGALYLSAATAGNDQLVEVDPVTGAGTLVGDAGFDDITGMGFFDDVLYGYTADGRLLSINIATGSATQIGSCPAASGATVKAPELFCSPLRISVDATVLCPGTATGIHASAAEIVSWSASGEVINRTGGPKFGPDGDPANPGDPGYCLPSANLASLIGQIGSTRFLMGASGSIAAPEAGELFLSVNDDYYDDNSGSFEVDLGQEVFYSIDRLSNELLRIDPCSGSLNVVKCYDRPVFALDLAALDGSLYAITATSELLQIDPGTGQILSACPVTDAGHGVYAEGLARESSGLTVAFIKDSDGGTFQVDGTHGCDNWVDTGVIVGPSQGFPFQVLAQGNVGTSSTACLFGPEGVPGTSNDPNLCLPSSNAGVLLGMVEGNVFEIGGARAVVPPASGSLFLGVNDAPSFYGDNQGSFSVQVSTLPSSGDSTVLGDLALDGLINNRLDWDALGGVDFGGDFDYLSGIQGLLVSAAVTGSSFELYELDRTPGMEASFLRLTGGVSLSGLALASSGDLLLLNGSTSVLAVSTETAPMWMLRSSTALICAEGRDLSGFASVRRAAEPHAPALMASIDAISVCSGGVQTLCLSAGEENAGKPYMLLGTSSGTSPGVRLGGMTWPLKRDSYFTWTLDNLHSGVDPLPDSFGLLDCSGQARASVVLAPGSNPALIGKTFHHAFGVLENERAGSASTSGGHASKVQRKAIVFVSNPVAVVLTE